MIRWPVVAGFALSIVAFVLLVENHEAIQNSANMFSELNLDTSSDQFFWGLLAVGVISLLLLGVLRIWPHPSAWILPLCAFLLFVHSHESIEVVLITLTRIGPSNPRDEQWQALLAFGLFAFSIACAIRVLIERKES